MIRARSGWCEQKLTTMNVASSKWIFFAIIRDVSFNCLLEGVSFYGNLCIYFNGQIWLIWLNLWIPTFTEQGGWQRA
jgi:hypothetical protein